MTQCTGLVMHLVREMGRLAVCLEDATDGSERALHVRYE
jgi:hypothetical protein